MKPTERTPVVMSGRRTCRSWRLASSALAALLVAGAAGAQSSSEWSGTPAVGLGPLILRSQSPLSLLRLTPIPLAPVTVPAGAWQTGAVVNWNNYFDVDPKGRYTIDAETVGVTFGVAYGINDRVDVNLAVPVSWRGGGILDPFVERFEGWLGVPNETRKAYPRDRYLVLVVAADGTVYERSGRDEGWGLEDVSAGVRYQISEGSETAPALLAFAGVKLPTGREASLRSSGGTDLQAGLALGQKLGRFNLYASLAGMRFATDEIAGIQLTRHQWSLFTGAEFRKSARTSWLLQSVITSPGAKHFGDFSKKTYEITLGFKRLLARDLMLEASVLENLFIFDNSPDVGFHVGLVWRTPAPRE